MIESPWFLCLLVLFPLYFYFWNKKKFYFRHPYTKHLSGSINWFNWQYFVLIGSFLLVIGASNFIWQTKETRKVSLVHKYVLVNDGSGSMVNGAKENGIGKELTAILSGNEKLLSFLGNRNDGSKDLVGAIVFADEAFTVSYLCDDPKFVHNKLLRIDYRAQPMNGGTNIGAGIWASIEMILAKTISQDNLDRLQLRFYGEGHQLKSDDFIQSIVVQKDKFVGSSVIFFTDGIFQDAAGSKTVMSTYKLINFCKDMGIRVYFISIFELDDLISKYSKDTGGRGEVVLNYDKKKLEQIYEEIATSQAQEYVMKDVVVDRSFAQWFGITGLGFVLLGVILHNTRQLSFTEV